jgi:hypothetical protein
LYCTINNSLDLNFDHSSVILNINASTQLHNDKPSLFTTTTDRYKFHDIINQNINLKIKLKSEHDIDEAVNNLTTLIHSVASLSNTKKNPNHLSHKHPFLPEQVRSLIVEKRRARALYQYTRLSSHKSAYNRLANSLKKTLAKLKATIFEQKLNRLSSLDGSLWIKTKKILQYKTPATPLKKPDNSLAFSDYDKAELFKTHLHETFQPHHNILIPQQVNMVNTFLNLPPSHSPPVRHFTSNEVKHTILKYSKKKSPGFNLITTEVTRCLLKKVIDLITYIFNASLRLSYFPILWKISNIILFAKPDKQIDTPTSFRPISLLPFLSKILERLILKRIFPYIMNNSIFPNTQFWFCNSHSMIHQVHRVVDAISTFFPWKKNYTALVFF